MTLLGLCLAFVALTLAIVAGLAVLLRRMACRAQDAATSREE